MAKSAIVLFSGGKDSCMALSWALKKKYNCIAVIAINGQQSTQLSDGPEARSTLVKAIAKDVFNVPIKTVKTFDQSFKNDILAALTKYLKEQGAALIITGDLDHPDGIIHFLKNNLAVKYPKTKFLSIGDIYRKNGRLDEIKYLNDATKILNLIISGIRLPDFELHKDLLGKTLNKNTIGVLKKANIDPTGEDGEYQSLCIGLNKRLTPRISIDSFIISDHLGRDTKNYHYQILDINKFHLTYGHKN